MALEIVITNPTKSWTHPGTPEAVADQDTTTSQLAPTNQLQQPTFTSPHPTTNSNSPAEPATTTILINSSNLTKTYSGDTEVASRTTVRVTPTTSALTATAATVHSLTAMLIVEGLVRPLWEHLTIAFCLSPLLPNKIHWQVSLNYLTFHIEEKKGQPSIQIQHTVSDEDFSNILGGALYLKASTVEITSDCSQ